jgi:hypothetical protein
MAASEVVRALWRKLRGERYRLLVDDNSHHMDESERYEAGSFATREAAQRAAQEIVDQYLESVYTPGMTADELYGSYTSWGEDPFIVSPRDDDERHFSAWDYARQRCEELCRPTDR